MKTFMVVACLLIIAGMVYGVADQKHVQKFYKDWDTCSKELKVPKEIRPDIFMCVIAKEGTLLDEQGAIKKDRAVQKMAALISDPGKLKESQELISKCHDDAFHGKGSNQDKNMKLIKCAMSVVGNIDKM